MCFFNCLLIFECFSHKTHQYLCGPKQGVVYWCHLAMCGWPREYGSQSYSAAKSNLYKPFIINCGICTNGAEPIHCSKWDGTYCFQPVSIQPSFWVKNHKLIKVEILYAPIHQTMWTNWSMIIFWNLIDIVVVFVCLPCAHCGKCLPENAALYRHMYMDHLSTVYFIVLTVGNVYCRILLSIVT